MPSIKLSVVQQDFLCEMFETKDIFFAFEKFQNMLLEEGGDTYDTSVYLERLMKKWKDRKSV